MGQVQRASWLKDGSGFFYSRFDEPKKGEELQQQNYYQKLFFHKIGTPQSEDVLVYQRPDQKEWGFGGYVTDDGRYLVIYVSQGSERKNRVFYKDLQAAGRHDRAGRRTAAGRRRLVQFS
jgi:prolyl oligopeptidase